MKFFLIFVLALIIWLSSTPSLAAKPTSTTVPPVEKSLSEQAILENADPTPAVILKTKKSTAPLTPVIPEAAIRLDDTYSAMSTRSWDWTVALGLEPYRPQAQASFSDIQTYDTSDVGSTIMPSISFGFIRELNTDKSFSVGTKTKLAYARQNYNLVLPTLGSTSAHLDTLMLSLKPYLRYNFTKYNMAFGAEFGQYQLSQGSDRSITRWSMSSPFNGGYLAAGYDYNADWTLLLEASFRQLSQEKSDLQLSSNSLTFQTEYRW